MKVKLIVLGEKIRYNKPFYEYLIRSAEKQLGFFDEILFLAESSKELIGEIDEHISESEILVIYVDRDYFTTAAKLIATLTDDSLKLKDDLLVPSKSDLYSDNSFLTIKGNTKLNLIAVKEGQKADDILATPESKHSIFQIFKTDFESVALLVTPLAETHGVKFVASKVAHNWTEVVATSTKHGELAKFNNSIKSLFYEKAIATSNLALYIIERFFHTGKSISFAESCSGGLLAYYFTKVGGASKIYHGSVITYSNEFKKVWLGITPETLENYGAVSETTIREMLEGAMSLTHADFVIAISGIAGPTGDTQTKPVGTVFYGVRSKSGKEVVERSVFDGDRNYIQEQSVLNCVRLLVEVAEEFLF